MEEDVEVKHSDVVADDDVRIDFPDLCHQEAEEGSLRFHFVDLFELEIVKHWPPSLA
jgi:hypothetical protein